MSKERPTLLVEVTNVNRGGTSKAGNPYVMFQGFVWLPGVPYPQMNMFYAEKQSEIPPIGTYECEIQGEIRDGRLSLTIDPRKGVRVNMPAVKAQA